MGKRPASQFYWSDWLADTALRACSVAARGLWIDMLALMHEGEPYGHLRTGEADITTEELARMAGLDKKQCAALLAELERRKVYSRTEEGTIYSRRMVRDERVRDSRAKGGVLSTLHPNTIPPKEKDEGSTEGYPSDHPPTVPFPPPPSSSSPSSVSEDKSSSDGVPPPKVNARPFWDRFCALYPPRDGDLNKAKAAVKFAALIKGGTDPEAILGGVEAYRRWCDAKGNTGTQYVAQMTTWLNNSRWGEDYTIPGQSGGLGDFDKGGDAR